MARRYVNPIMKRRISGKKNPIAKRKIGGKGINTRPKAPRRNAASNVKVRTATTAIKPVKRIT